MIAINLAIVRGLMNSLSLMFVIAFLMSLTKPFRKTMYGDNPKLISKLLLAVVFGSIGILGTYYGFPVDGAIANSRAVPIVAAGLLAGPIAGIGAGIIAGTHRYAIDIGGFTASACMVSTIAEGMIGALAHQLFIRTGKRWFVGFWATVVAEVMQMSIILWIARPYDLAWTLVEKIGAPMIIVNAVGVALFVLLHEMIYKDREREAAVQSQLALRIAEKTLPILRQGFSHSTALQTCEIILAETQLDAVAMASCKEIMAHVGEGADHHLAGSPAQTNLTTTVLATGIQLEAATAEEIECQHKGCGLQSAIIVPLCSGKQLLGVLKLYKKTSHSITSVERQLAEGLAKHFSTQFELAEKDTKEQLLARAELKALQAQINPHFMFNALNTIVSFCRTEPETARTLLLNLGDFLRASFVDNSEFISLNKELDHVEAYLAIEKARFGPRLKVEYDLQAADFNLPPLVLQPLVENAIRHGILPRTNGGVLRIESFNSEDHHVIKIIDNGVGFDLHNVVASGNGIGLDNVDKRLRNLYGAQNGLMVVSETGHGTTCTVRIPREVARCGN